MPTTPDPALPPAPLLEAVGTMMAQRDHTRACGCLLCLALAGARMEYEARTSLAVVVQAEAAHERQHPPEQGWGPIWQTYREATRYNPGRRRGL